MRKLTLFVTSTLCGIAFGIVTAAQGAVVVANGNFETDAALFVAWPGYVGFTEDGVGTNPDAIPGWTHTGGVGINPVVPGEAGDAPFNNGNNTGAFAFLQGASSITQIVGGFSVGTEYVLSIDVNARNCCGDFPIAEVKIDGATVASSADAFPDPGSIIPAGDGNPWYHFDIPFTATAATHEIGFSSAPAAGGDATFIIDNVTIVPEPTATMLGLLGLGLVVLRRRR